MILAPSPWFSMPPPLSLVVCWLPSTGDCRDVDEEGDRYRGEREVHEDVGDISLNKSDGLFLGQCHFDMFFLNLKNCWYGR